MRLGVIEASQTRTRETGRVHQTRWRTRCSLARAPDLSDGFLPLLFDGQSSRKLQQPQASFSFSATGAFS